MSNILLAHGGGPTPVINASLSGAIEEIQKEGFGGRILAARFGSAGLLKEDFIDLSSLTKRDLALLRHTPGSAIGTCRYPLDDKEYEQIVEILRKNDIKYVLFTGGNGTMDTLGHIHDHAEKHHDDIVCDGIPKTVDNDVAVTDHAPGFPSIARYMAESVHEIAQDVKGLPIHVVIIEAMGRDAGWVTASAALAREKTGDAPHLLYFPELVFNEEQFLKDVQREREKHGGVIVVVSEGLHNADGSSIVEPIFRSDRAVYFGDVATHLAALVIKKLGVKARSEKPGLFARASSSLASALDIEEAVRLGALAAKTALEGKSGYMAGLKRLSSTPYKTEDILIPIHEVMLSERTMPRAYVNAEGNDVTPEFLEWGKPLIGELTPMISFLD
jgi:6-phosphofructokinase